MLNLQHIQYFSDAAQEGSISSAGRKNHISASAVSQAIRQLELTVGSSLIDHKRNRFQLTEEGKILANECQELIKHANNLKTVLKQRRTGISGKLEFGTQQSFAQSVLPGFLAYFQKKFPEVIPKFRLATSNIVQRWIEDDEIDFGITLDNVVYPGCTLTPVISGEFVFVSSREVNVTLLKDIGVLLTGDTPETRLLEKHFRVRFRQEIPVRMRVDSWGVIRNLSSKGLGVGLVPDYLIAEGVKIKASGMKALGLPKLKYSVCVVSRKGKPLSKLSEEFTRELQRWHESQRRL